MRTKLEKSGKKMVFGSLYPCEKLRDSNPIRVRENSGFLNVKPRKSVSPTERFSSLTNLS